MATDPYSLGKVFVDNPDEAWEGDAGLSTLRIRPDKVLRTCLVILTVLAALSAFYFARSILVPLVLALIVAVPLRPLVTRLARRGVPPAASALMGLFAISAASLLVVLPIVGQIQALELTDPVVLTRYADRFRERLSPVFSMVGRVKDSAESIEQGMNEAGDEDEAAGKAGVISAADPDKKVETEGERLVVVEKPPALLSAFGNDAVGTTTTILSSILIFLVTIYFVLASGDQLIARVIDIGDTADERNKLQAVSQGVKSGLTTYLTTVTLVNAGLGVAIGMAMWLMDVPGALLIGFMAFLFNFVPMVGALVGMFVSLLVAVMAFPPSLWEWWLIVPAVYFTFTTIEGNFVTPSLIGRSMEMNPLIVFLSLVLWGWIWGLAGVIVAVPILAATKSVLENFESTRDGAAIIG